MQKKTHNPQSQGGKKSGTHKAFSSSFFAIKFTGSDRVHFDHERTLVVRPLGFLSFLERMREETVFFCSAKR